MLRYATDECRALSSYRRYQDSGLTEACQSNPSPQLPLTSQMRGEYFAQIRHLARDQYLQLEMGTEEDFDELWREAFHVEVDRASQPED